MGEELGWQRALRGRRWGEDGEIEEAVGGEAAMGGGPAVGRGRWDWGGREIGLGEWGLGGERGLEREREGFGGRVQGSFRGMGESGGRMERSLIKNLETQLNALCKCFASFPRLLVLYSVVIVTNTKVYLSGLRHS